MIKIKNLILNKIHIIFLLIGLCIYCYSIILSLGTLFPGNLGDGLWTNYVLEHGFLFLQNTVNHKSFWDMPFYFPHTNTLAYSDFMLGAIIVYIPIRTIIKDPFYALHAWFILTCILNYYSMYYLLHKIFNFNKIPSSIGSLVFAFSLLRYTNMGNYQFQTQFYMILSFIAFFKINKNCSKIRNNICFLFGTIFFIIQLYTSFYLAWYMVYGLAIFILIAIFSPNIRIEFLSFIKTYRYEIILYSIITMILSVTLIKHYLAVETEFDYYGNERLIKFVDFIYSNNIIENHIFHSIYKDSERFIINPDNSVCMGYITFILFSIGLILTKKYRIQILFFFIISFSFFVSENLNILLYRVFPGASAIRFGFRLVFILLPVISYYIANLFEHLQKKKILSTVILILMLIELVPTSGNFESSKISINEYLSNVHIPNNCNIYFADVDFYSNVQYMFQTNYIPLYTINGYSGHKVAFDTRYIPEKCVVKNNK